MLIGTIAAVVVGIVVALPAIRTRGMTLGVTTLALALVFTALIFENPSLTGGFDGLVVGTPRIAGFDVDPLMHPQRYATVVLVAFLVLSLVVANVRVGGAGRSMIAVRSNERAAAAVGISVIGVKLYAFALSAGIAAVGGILLAFRQPNVNFLAFDVFGSIQLVVYAVLGGIGWISGAVVGGAQAPGGVATRVLSDALPDSGDIGTWIAIVGGVLVLLAIRKSPDGAAAMVAAAYRGLRPSPGTPGSVLAAPAPPRSRAAGRGQAIAVRDVSVRFGGVNAVDGVSFSASPGEVVGLIGPNGAGKTTLLDVISGFARPAAGLVLLGGEDISSWSPTRRGRAGIARSWQAVELFDDLTVRENLLVAEEARRARHYFRELLWRRRTALSAEAMAVVDDLGLRDVLDERPPTLPTGVAKLVGIARATVATPGVVLLDEPAAGLDDIETRELGEVIRRIAGSGTTVVVIEHDMSLIRTACDRIVVLDFGRKIADGHPDDVCASDVVVRAYLGEPAREVDAARVGGEPLVTALLEATGLVAGYRGVAVIRDLDIVVEPGELVALLGPNGAGKTTTLLTLAGELAPLAGSVRCLGLEGGAGLHRRSRAGLALITDRRTVLTGLTIEENARVFRVALDAVLSLFPELVAHRRRQVGLLSGGQQQMLALGLALARKPPLVLVDELSMGLAPLIVDRLFAVLRTAVDGGAGVLLVEQHVHRAMTIADRVYVLDRGRIRLAGDTSDLRSRVDEIQRSYLAAERPADLRTEAADR